MRTVTHGLVTPTSLAFLGADDILVLEKNTGRVRRVVGGQIQSTVLDLPVNFGSELGLLGITLHPDFPHNPSVYLHWTESSTGADTGVLSDTPLLGNRVDRFVWDGAALTFAQNLIRLRALQQDANQPERGNQSANPTYHLRSPERIGRFFDGLELVEPGVVSPPRWRPDPSPSGPPAEVDSTGGVGRKP